MTHADLVERAARWLRNTRRCVLVVTEFSGGSGEQPDAMGWTSQGASVLIECKVGRNDFHADKRKPWRWARHLGVGMERYYMTPPDLLLAMGGLGDEFPDGWGLLEVHGRIVRVMQKAVVGKYEYGPRREISILTNVARRLGGEFHGYKPSDYLTPATPTDPQPSEGE